MTKKVTAEPTTKDREEMMSDASLWPKKEELPNEPKEEAKADPATGENTEPSSTEVQLRKELDELKKKQKEQDEINERLKQQDRFPDPIDKPESDGKKERLKDLWGEEAYLINR